MADNSNEDADPKALPIYTHQDELLETIRRHQVVVVEGPAGTGKTTQLPRILRNGGLSTTCIGITQPRRIAAVSVAWRIATEENSGVGDSVGYAIRFDDCTSPNTVIKLMTDGILLQEARGDPVLSAYDVIMVDEAHERSLNIDFVLGLLHRIVTRRGDLRVVVSSATLHPGHFERFFASVAGDVPRVAINRRVHPVDIQYNPQEGRRMAELAETVAHEVLDLHGSSGPGHILVFLPGEGLIRQTEARLNEALNGHSNAVVLPLFGRLTREEQERVFLRFPGKRKVILATNIAETSITIPGVNYVVDTGLQKLPWFNARTGVTTLREGSASRAQLDQRAGRAGRTGPGTIVRLFSEDSYRTRDRFTPEEILRLDLSEAVLRLIDLGIRDVEDFPFPTQPPRGKLRAAIRTLQTMHAIDQERRLTSIGERMVPFPLSPYLARMVVEAADRFPQAMDDVLLVGAFLSVRSPYSFPQDQEMEARAAHRAQHHKMGDIVTAVRVFRRWEGARNKKRFASRHFLDNETMAFIDRAHRQLVEIAADHGFPVSESKGDPAELVRCVLAGFADRVLIRYGRSYESLSGLRVAVHPSSSAYGKDHRLLVAADITQVSRLYAFNASPIQETWLVEANPEAAQQWRLGRGRQRRTETPRAAPTPQIVSLGGVSLSGKVSGGRLRIDIPQDAVGAVAMADLSTLPPESASWRARVLTEHGVALRGALYRVVRLLPFVSLPTPGKPLPSDVPTGALLELDRNYHTLGRFLGRLLQPSLRHKKLGWLALVGNGAGGYWYEAMPDFVAAVWSSMAALEQLQQSGPSLEPIADAVAQASQDIERLQRAMEAIL